MHKYLLPFIAFMVIVAFLAVGLQLNPKQVPSPLIGKAAPDFQLPSLSNAAQHITPQDLLGQVWMLNVWASWCGACKQEHPLLVELAQQQTVTIVGMNYKDENAKAKQWLADFGNPYQMIAVDTDGRTGIDYGVYGVPETYIIDKTGKIIFKQIGVITRSALQTKILPLIKGLQAQ